MTAQNTAEIPKAFAFGPFVLYPDRQMLLGNGTPVRMGGRAFDILTALVERQGEVLSKQELMSRAWPNSIVDDGNLKVNMASLRRALGDDSGPPRYVATVVGRGYRFIAPVQHDRTTLMPPVAGDQSGPNHNLPIGATRIVGRSESIASIMQDLEGSRLVSLVGPGGIGKTTVALAVAEQAVSRFDDGVWLIDLATLTDPSLVPNAIAMAIGLTAHSANMLAAVCSALRDRKMLLVMDNCEHLIDAVASSAQRILSSSKDVKILATTREPLNIRGERVRRLPGLGVPPVSARLNADDALAFAAVQLFVDRATDRNAFFSLSDGDAAIVAEICRKLDGVALAIELAATRIDAFGLSELLAQLDDHLRLLRGHRAAPERHRTLTATIDWSYELLSESQQAIMRRLSIFAGTFGLGAACSIAADEDLDRIRVVDDLGNLVAKSLVTVEAFDSEVEYRLLDTTRNYAFEKLSASGELEEIRRRHTKYAIDLAERAGRDSEKLINTQWFDRYRSKIDDVRLALRNAFAQYGTEALGVRLTVAAIPYWEKLSLLDECRAATERALGEQYGPFRSERDDLVLHLAFGAARLFTRGPLPELRDVFVTALGIAEKIGDTDLKLECLRGLSQYDLWAGDSRSSLTISEQVRSIAMARSDVATADGQAGSALHYIGDLAAARRFLESSLEAAVAPRSGRAKITRFEFDQRLEALGSLAMVLWLQGFPDQALKLAERQRQEAEACNYAVPYCAAILLTSVCISLYVGQFEETESSLDFVETYAAEHGLSLWSVIAACMRMKLHLDQGKAVEFSAHAKALAEIRNGGVGMRYPPFLANHGHIQSQLGDLDGALQSVDEAIALSVDSGQMWGIPEMLRMKGNFIRAGRQPGARKAASDCYIQSIEMARQHGSLTWELRSAIQLVDLHRETGGDARAEDMLASAFDRFSEGHWTIDLQQASSLLDSRAKARNLGA